MLVMLGYAVMLIGLVCAIIILIDAFKSAVWKGIVGFLCGFYLLYYAFVEFKHEKKSLIIAGWLLPMILGYGLVFMGAAQAIAR